MSRANDIYENRIEKVLSAMDSIKLYALPKSEPWTLDRFLEEIKDACKDAAADLNRKSVMIEDAVEDLIGLGMFNFDSFLNQMASTSVVNFSDDEFCDFSEFEDFGEFGEFLWFR